MANSQPNSGAGAKQQAGAAPETIWRPFIRDLYPKLLSQTFFLPPIHFNRTPQAVEIVAGQTVLVRDNPSASSRRQPLLPPPPAQVAGTLFVKNASGLQPVRIQDSDQQDDTAQELCLRALSDIPNQVMMVISSLVFQKYLNNLTNPLHAAAIAQLPTIQHQSIPPQIADGECDIVIIHRGYGLMIGEIKSVGGNDFFHSQGPDDQTQLIVKKVGAAVKQLRNQEAALRHLVSDLPPIRITKTLLLPNISCGQLRSALSASPLLLQELSNTLSLPQTDDVKLAVRHCLCQQDLAQPSIWWQRLMLSAGPDQCMTDELYQRLVARFCGPASTVDIPTAGTPRKVVRSLGQAVAETGLRFSSLTLTPTQVSLLNNQPEPCFMYLQGPPGTGKTVVLLLKALQWARKCQEVVIVDGGEDSLAVTVLLESQLRSIVGPAATGSSRIRRLCYDFSEGGFDVQLAVSSLQQQIGPGPGPVIVIFDEIGRFFRNQYIQWLTEVRTQLPTVSVWAAGMYTLDKDLTVPLPSWLEVQTLQESLRCPPTVMDGLERTGEIAFHAIRRYSEPQHAVTTQGPPGAKAAAQGSARSL